MNKSIKIQLKYQTYTWPFLEPSATERSP